MNNKTRYYLFLIGLAVLVATTTVFVQRTRLQRAETEVIKRKVALSANSVNNKTQLEQVVTIQQQVRKHQPLNDEQIAQLLTVVDGPPDVILKAKALATLIVANETGVTPVQKTKIIASVTKALADPDSLVRLYSVSVLRSFDDPGVVASLLPLLNDPDQNVKSKANQAVEDLKKMSSAK